MSALWVNPFQVTSPWRGRRCGFEAAGGGFCGEYGKWEKTLLSIGLLLALGGVTPMPPPDRALKLSKEWQRVPSSASLSDAARSSFRSATLRITAPRCASSDIQLQPGEKVNNVKIGDKVRWKIEGARSPEGAGDRAPGRQADAGRPYHVPGGDDRSPRLSLAAEIDDEKAGCRPSAFRIPKNPMRQ